MMITDRNSRLTVFLLGFAGILMSATAVAEDIILITTQPPTGSDSTGDVIEQRSGGFGGESFISGGDTVEEPQKILFGPDGNLYVLGENSSGGYFINRYDGTTGDFIDTFIPTSSGLTEAKNMIFGPDGNLYVSVNEGPSTSFDEGGEVWRFDGTTGAFIDVFIANGAGGTPDDERLGEASSLLFGPDGNLYVGNSVDFDDNNVLRFNATTGAFIDVFVATNSNGLYDPDYAVFGPDGNLYISNEGDGTNDDSVLRFNGTTGAFINVFVPSGSGGIGEPKGLIFGFDGDLYVVGGDSDGVYRYDGSTGNFIEVFVPEENGNLRDSRSLLFTMRVAQIPTLNPWAMALLALALAGLAGFVLVRRKRGLQT